MKFNEDSRVKIPSILHLTRLGYEYISLKNTSWDENTNIFKDLFVSSIKNINKNKNLKDEEVLRV
jgi:type I restriction enzyme R subunit